MRLTTVILLSALAGIAGASGDAATTPLAIDNPQSAIVDETDAIAIPRMLSYQGKLTDTLGASVPNGSYSLSFRLYTVPSGGSHFWGETQSVTTTDGLFSVLLGAVTPIAYVPDAGNCYLEMQVGGGAALAPRTRIVSAAYAYKADTANYALAGAGGGGDNAWVRGSPDSVLFTVHQLGVAKGGAGNAVYATTFASTHVNLGVACTTGTSGQNYAYSTVGGGWRNVAANSYAAVGGGVMNRATGEYAAVGGGTGNSALGSSAVVGGGYRNSASGSYSTVGGGQLDTAYGHASAVLSGWNNNAGNFAYDTGTVIAGGRNNRASGRYTTIGGGFDNSCGENSTVAGGISNSASVYGVVSGGLENIALGLGSTVGGGRYNRAGGIYSVIPAGYGDTASASYSFATNNLSVVATGHDNSAAFNGQRTTASNQTRVGVLSKASGTFTIDHPLDPQGMIFNHYFIEGPEMRNIYDGEVVLDGSGRTVVVLPDYFAVLNRNPRVQLTGVGTPDVYVAEKVSGNLFTVGGPPGTEVYWQVTGERKDVSAEVTRRMMPVEQPKSGELAGRMLDDDFLSGCMDQLVWEGKASGIDFRTAAGRQKYERSRQMLGELGR